MQSNHQTGRPAIDWVTRVPVARATYYGPDRSGLPGVMRDLRVSRASIHSGHVGVDRVTLSLGRADHDPYGVEVDFTPLGCRQLSALLWAAADHVDAGGEAKDFMLAPDDVGD